MHTTIWMELGFAELKKPDAKDIVVYVFYLHKILELEQVI